MPAIEPPRWRISLPDLSTSTTAAPDDETSLDPGTRLTSGAKVVVLATGEAGTMKISSSSAVEEEKKIVDVAVDGAVFVVADAKTDEEEKIAVAVVVNVKDEEDEKKTVAVDFAVVGAEEKRVVDR